jgi:hypothetical protein
MKLLHAILILSLLQLTSLSSAGSLHLLENIHSSGESLHFHHFDITDHLDIEEEHDEKSHSHMQIFELSHHYDLSLRHAKEPWKEISGFCVLRMSYEPSLPPPNNIG